MRLLRVATQSAATDPRTGRIDMDLINTGRSASSRIRTQQLVQVSLSLSRTHARTHARARARSLSLCSASSRIRTQRACAGNPKP